MLRSNCLHIGGCMADLPAKPRSQFQRPELTRMPRLTVWRRVIRRLLRSLAWLVLKTCTRTRVTGMHNFPRQGAAIIATNHLGDVDALFGLAYFPRQMDALAKIDLYIDYPPLGWLIDLYGVIWLHRGQPDRRALKTALYSLSLGRLVGISPEGRESLSGALEEGTGGAAYLAIKAGVPVVPVTYTGTENARVFGCLRRLRRPEMTLTVGPKFNLPAGEDWRHAIQQGTQIIMQKFAQQLPPAYRGVYKLELEKHNDSQSP